MAFLKSIISAAALGSVLVAAPALASAEKKVPAAKGEVRQSTAVKKAEKAVAGTAIIIGVVGIAAGAGIYAAVDNPNSP